MASTADRAANITELEATNVVVALHTLLTLADKGKHIRIRCDNQAAVIALTSSRAQNKVLQDCARAAWMVQAILSMEITYDHVPGKDNEVADALSRAHISRAHKDTANHLVNHYSLQPVRTCCYFLYNLNVPITSRSGIGVAPPEGYMATGYCKRSGDDRQPQGGSTHVHRLHGQVQAKSAKTYDSNDVRVHRVPGQAHPSPRYNKEQDIACASVSAAGRAPNGRDGPPESEDGPRSHGQEQVLQRQCKAPTVGKDRLDRNRKAPADAHWMSSEGSHPHNLLWRSTPIGDSANDCENIRQVGSKSAVLVIKWGKNMQKVGQKKVVTLPRIPNSVMCLVQAIQANIFSHTHMSHHRSPHNVHGHETTNPGITHKEGVAR